MCKETTDDPVKEVLHWDAKASACFQEATSVYTTDLPRAQRLVQMGHKARGLADEARRSFNSRRKRMNHDANPPWRRYVIFAPDGRPFGWAMGIIADHAIRNLFGQQGINAPERLSEEEVAKRWAGQVAMGYSVRPVDLVPALEEQTDG